MYKIDTANKRITPLAIKTFSELGFTERFDLQEWIAHSPESLGEELLIIQKEFDGFDDTRERLDLLALDKQGNLVIIENKLDDSGRDVVWQALKYASYCSGLSKQNIIDIFQQYLNKYSLGGDAHALIGDFLDVVDIDEVLLNSGNRQRIILVAANFRKEVTSTALWLLGYGIELQCIKVSPYALGETLLLNIDQIIPPAEVKELMIGMNAKEAEQKQTEATQLNSHTLRLAFWEAVLEDFRQSDCKLYNNISPSKDHWSSAGSGISGCVFNLIFGKKEARVQLEFRRASEAENKALFDAFECEKSSIEKHFGHALEWLRLDNKKSSRIQFTKDFDGFNRDEWPAMRKWLVTHMSLLEKAMRPVILQASSVLEKM